MTEEYRTQLLMELLRESALPLHEASTMPPALHTSPEIHALELERIFAKEWLCPGLAADIPEPGDYLTFEINDQPVFTIRSRDGTVRSFSNVCRHRMMVLLEGRGNRKKVVCPYHAWTYGLDGGLLGAGHMQRTENFDKRRFGLPEIRTEVWNGWIYITLNREAPPVAELLTPLAAVVDRYRMAGYIPVVQQDHVWNTNWKLLCENFMEGYHLPVAHRATVGAWFPVEDTGFPDQSFGAFTYQTFTKTETAKYGRAHPANAHLEGAWRYTSVMPTIFPTHMYVLAPDHFWYLSLRPNGVGQVHVRFGVALAPEVYHSLEDPDAEVTELVQFFDAVNAEDRAVVEGIYRGARAPLATSGPLSWLEREIHDFMGYLARRLAPEQPVEHRTGEAAE